MQNNISNMDSIRNHVYLAALLHDIGKFYQRADEDSTASSKILDERVKIWKMFFCLHSMVKVHINMHCGLLSLLLKTNLFFVN